MGVQRNVDIVPSVLDRTQIQTSSQFSQNANMMSNEVKVPQYIVVMSNICLSIGIITILGIALSVFGTFSGTFFSNNGMDMMAGLLLIGGIYYTIMAGGSIFSIVTFVLILLAKHKAHIPIQKPLLMTTIGLTMIHLPNIILIL